MENLSKLSDQELRELNRKYQQKSDRERPCNDPAWPHIIRTLKRIDAEFERRAVALRA